jgi:hypothetical protein
MHKLLFFSTNLPNSFLFFSNKLLIELRFRVNYLSSIKYIFTEFTQQKNFILVLCDINKTCPPLINKVQNI